MKSNFKVTLLIAFVSAFFVGFNASAQDLIPIKSGDTWSYQNESTGEILLAGLEKAEPFRSGVGFARKNGKWGALDKSMREVIAFEHDQIQLILPNVVRSLKQNRFTLYSLDGKELLSNLTSAENAEIIENAIIVSDDNRMYGMISSDGKEIIPLKYSRAPEVVNETDLLFYKLKGKKYYQGVLNQKGEEIVPFDYVFVQYLQNGHYIAVDNKKRYHFYNLSGEEIYEAETNSVQFIDSAYIIERREESVLLNLLATGKKVTHEQIAQSNRMLFGLDSNKTTVYYPNGKSFSQKGMWRVRELRDDWFLMQEATDNRTNHAIWNEKGKVKIEGVYPRIHAWSKKWLVVSTVEHPRKQVLIDLNKKKEVGVYDRVDLLTCDNLRITQDGKIQLVDDRLQELNESDLDKKAVYLNLSEKDLQGVRREYFNLTQQRFDEAFEGEDDCGGRDLKEVKISNLRLVKDRYGKEPLPNRLIVDYWDQDKRRFALLNFEGKVIVDDGRRFGGYHFNGLIEYVVYERLDVGAISRHGFMDADGTIVFPAEYDKIQELHGDTAIVVLHGLYSMIQIRTKEVIMSGYEGIGLFNNGYYGISQNGKRGIADAKGKVLVQPIYDQVHFGTEGDGLFEAERDRKKYYVDQNGNEIPRE